MNAQTACNKFNVHVEFGKATHVLSVEAARAEFLRAFLAAIGARKSAVLKAGDRALALVRVPTFNRAVVNENAVAGLTLLKRGIAIHTPQYRMALGLAAELV